MEEASSALAPLPLSLAQRIFLSLPADSRARAACVARGWRAVLADPELWTRLDLSHESGFSGKLNVDAVLRGAAARARGRLRLLDVSGRFEVDATPVLEVLAANADSMRELHVGTWYRNAGDETPDLEDLLSAAPRLQALRVSMSCSYGLAARLLRAEPPFAPLRLSALQVCFVDNHHEEAAAGLDRVAPFADALTDAALQPELWSVQVRDANTAQTAVMGALVDAVLARGLHALTLYDCTPPAAAPLARLLAGERLKRLALMNSPPDVALFDEAGAGLVADALRANTTLEHFRLVATGLCRDTRAAQAVLGALTGHRSLNTLMLKCERPADPAAMAAALAAIVAADAPSLQVLDIHSFEFSDDCLAPIVAALPSNRHLRELDIAHDHMSEAFARDCLLPAVRANTGLRKLVAAHMPPLMRHLEPAATEAEELVRSRPPRG